MPSEKKYHNVINYLSEYIRDRELRDGDPMPTESELVSKFSYSRVTIRKALDEFSKMNGLSRVRGRGTYIKYKGNGLSTPVSKVSYFPILLSDTRAETGLLELYNGAESFLSERSCFLLLKNIGSSMDRELELINYYISNGFKYMIIENVFTKYRSGNENAERFISAIKKHQDDGVRFVIPDRELPDFRVNVVESDNYRGGYDACSYLISKGHKKIGFIYTDIMTSTISERFNGYKIALEENNLRFDENYLFSIRDETGKYIAINNIVDKIKDMSNPPDALFISNDAMAYDFVRVSRSSGIDIPGDISIISFDGNAFSKLESITTVKQPFFEIGYKCAEIIYNLANCIKPENITVRVTLPTKIIERETVKNA